MDMQRKRAYNSNKAEAINSINDDSLVMKGKKIRATISFVVVSIMLLIIIFAAINIGSLHVSLKELYTGLFIRRIDDVAVIYNLRFPRIVISILAGAGVACSGVLFQAVLKNPLADPGIIGISGGSAFVASFVTAFFPSLFFVTPMFAFAGGILAFFIIYSLSWKEGLIPLRIILTGVAVSAMFAGLSSALNYMTGGSRGGVAAIVEGNIAQKTWSDVYTLLPYILLGLILALLAMGICNIMALEDKTARSLGIDIDKMRIAVSLIAVLLASICTAVAGAISFLGLIVPHIGRLLVGSNHKTLIPFSILLGAFTFLLADTVGRSIAAPYEVPAPIIMSVVGGPFFIILLRKTKNYGA